MERTKDTKTQVRIHAHPKLANLVRTGVCIGNLGWPSFLKGHTLERERSYARPLGTGNAPNGPPEDVDRSAVGKLRIGVDPDGANKQ